MTEMSSGEDGGIRVGMGSQGRDGRTRVKIRNRGQEECQGAE